MAVSLFLFSLGKNLDIFERGYTGTFHCAFLASPTNALSSAILIVDQLESCAIL